MTIIDEDMRRFLQNFASAAHTSNSVDPGQVLEDTLKRAQLTVGRQGNISIQPVR